jgi:transcription elongation factor Elf1
MRVRNCDANRDIKGNALAESANLYSDFFDCVDEAAPVQK